MLCNCDTRICSIEEGIVIWKFHSQNVIDNEASFCKVNAISEGMDLFLNMNMCLVFIFFVYQGRAPSEGSLSLDTSRAQRELISQLEAKNREIMREIARLRYCLFMLCKLLQLAHHLHWGRFTVRKQQ